LLKDSHLANERLTARVHELERANKALVAAQQAGLASPAVSTPNGSGVGGSGSGISGVGSGMATPGSYNGVGASPSGIGGHGGNSRGVALSTLVAERDAALSEMEVLEARAREAEKNADNMVDAMRRANDTLNTEMREARESLAEHERLVFRSNEEVEMCKATILEGRAEVEQSRVEVNVMKALAQEAEDTARKAATRAQRLESQSLDLKRRLNQLAQDLVASEQDLKVTAQNKIHLEQMVVGLRGDIKRLRATVQTTRTKAECEQLARTEAEEKLAAERRTRRREHENNSRRFVILCWLF